MRLFLTLIAAVVLLPQSGWAWQPSGTSETVTGDVMSDVPAPRPAVVQPRVAAAISSLVAAATLAVLYRYRRRAFILHWMGLWLLLSAALAISARPYPDSGFGRLAAGAAILFVVWSAGLAWLAAASFLDGTSRWGRPLQGAAAAAALLLPAPFFLPLTVVVWAGTALTLALVTLATYGYLRLGRRFGYNGALLIGGGLAAIVLSNLVAAAVLADVLFGAGVLNQLAVANALASALIVLGMHLLVFEDITRELRQANDEVTRLAIIDPLTGCHNRRFFEEIERRELQRLNRYQSALSVIFIDVRRFKQLNDSHGHDAGDEALKLIGAMLRAEVRASDYVFRWGGDEFLLVLNCGPADARRKATALAPAFQRARDAAGLPPWLGLSIGVATVEADAGSLREAIRHADAEMYRDRSAAL